MSQPPGDFEDLLRRALRSAADSVEPSEGSLERIRTRLTAPHSMPIAWMMAACPEVARHVLGGLRSGWVWLRTVLGPARERHRVARPGTPDRPRLARVRVATALAMA